ncbi:MAG: hypothetical protein KDD00_06925 [Ignavibacteriae bacterium]|nr:hypothetical protein [Ignavibacteriota bacterium]
MIKSPVLDLMKSFNTEEFKRFLEFLQSPYFNKNSNLVKVAKYLKKLVPLNNHDKLSEEKIWNAVYGKKEFNYGIMKNLVYELKKATERFLAVEHLEKNELYKELFVIKELNQRTLGEILEKKIVTSKNKIENGKMNISKLYFLYRFNSIDSVYKENLFSKESEKLADDEELSNSFINYFFASIFYLNYNRLINSKMLNTETDLKTVINFIEFYEKAFTGKNILSDLYYYAVKITLDPDNEECYDTLKKLLFDNYEILDHSSVKDFAAILSAYCQLKKSGSKNNYVQEEFDNTCFFLDKGLFNAEHNSFFDSNLFSRLAEYSLVLNKPEWCRDFIDKYKDQLSPLNREVRIGIAEIYLENHIGNYEHALEILSKTKPEKVIEIFKIRSIELIIFFNLKDYERVYTLIKNFRSYIDYEEKVSELVSKAYIDFLNYTRKLTDILVNSNNAGELKNDLEELYSNIQNKKIANKTWLKTAISNSLTEADR